MRNSARKRARNRSVKSQLHTLEKNYLQLVASGKKDEASTALKGLTSALDKAAKKGVVHSGKADRKKSRLSIRLAAAK